MHSIEEKIKEYWVKIHAMDAGRMAEKAKEAAKAQEVLNEFIDVLPPPIRYARHSGWPIL